MPPPIVLVPLAHGFEEIEAITVIDILRRANIEVITAGLSGDPVEASRNTRHLADTTLEAVAHRTFDLIVLPGGQPGTQNLKASPLLRDCLLRHAREKKWIAAICAAPTVFHELGLLTGKNVTAHPSARGELTGAHYKDEPVVVDGHLVTSRSAGTAMAFAFQLVELLLGKDAVLKVNQGVLAKL